MRIPLKSATDSGRNRPAIPEQSGRGRSEATLEFFSYPNVLLSCKSVDSLLALSDGLSFKFNLVTVVQ